MMNRNPTHREQLSSKNQLSKAIVIAELRKLLKNQTISPGMADRIVGENITVAIAAWETEAEDAFDVTLLVYGHNGQSAEVEGIPLVLVGKPTPKIVDIRRGKTNHRGDVGFLDLPQCTYKMRIPKLVGIVEEIEKKFPALIDDEYALAAESDSGARFRHKFPDSVIVTIQKTKRDTTVIYLTTDLSELNGKMVRVSLVNKESKDVSFCTDILLEAHKDNWGGAFEGEVSVSGPCDLEIELL